MKPWALILCWCAALPAAEIGVGPGKGFTRVEDAVAQAEPGDTIVVYWRGDGSPYTKSAIRITKPRIALRGMPDADGRRPVLDGRASDLSGAGAKPRAVVEFAPGSAGSSITGFTITGAHNASHNAAGVRIDQANDVTIAACEIEACDMGVFSNGAAAGAPPAMQRLTVRDCTIRNNGDPTEPGMSHNLYLGGTSARIVGCLIEAATTGHNLKSRLGSVVVEACLIRHAANRELDLVDARGTTDQPGGFALVLGCLIVKDPACSGNRGVIHWGQDSGAERVGTLFLVHNTIVTPFSAPVIELSSPPAQTSLANTVVCGPEANTESRQLIVRRGPGLAEPLAAAGVWLTANYAPLPATLGVTRGEPNAPLPLRDPANGDYRPDPVRGAALLDSAIPLAQLPLPIGNLAGDHPLRQRPPALLTFTVNGAVPRAMLGSALDIGAFESTP